MPMVLRRYYVDNLKLTSQGQAERLLAEMGLLNMDEFDKYAESKMPLLKNLMQMSDLNIRKAYQQSFSQLPRVASLLVPVTVSTYLQTLREAAVFFAWKWSG